MVQNGSIFGPKIIMSSYWAQCSKQKQSWRAINSWRAFCHWFVLFCFFCQKYFRKCYEFLKYKMQFLRFFFSTYRLLNLERKHSKKIMSQENHKKGRSPFFVVTFMEVSWNSWPLIFETLHSKKIGNLENHKKGRSPFFVVTENFEHSKYRKNTNHAELLVLGSRSSPPQPRKNT